MRSRMSLFVALFVVASFALPHVVHAAIPFFGPIIPNEYNRCAGGWGMLVTVINNVIEFLITIVITFVAPIMIAYSGFLFVANPVNAGGKEKAKGILTNTIVGIVVALSAWLIVDAIMAVLYAPPSDAGGAWGAWTTLVGSGGDQCLVQESSLKSLNQNSLVSGSSATGVLSVVPPSTAPSSERDIRQQLSVAGVSINHSTWCEPYNTNGVINGCTNVGGFLPSTVSQIINIRNACGVIVVTGGTEFGHSSNEGGTGSHGDGSKVDIGQDLTDCVLNHGGSRIAKPSFGDKQVRDKWGNIYTWEGNHTDVLVRSDGAL